MAKKQSRLVFETDVTARVNRHEESNLEEVILSDGQVLNIVLHFENGKSGFENSKTYRLALEEMSGNNSDNQE